MVEALTQEEKEAKKRQKFQLRCSHGHKLVVYQNGFKRRVNKSGQLIMPRSAELQCVACESTFEVEENGYVSCRSTCDWFICSKCSVCQHCGDPRPIVRFIDFPHRAWGGNEQDDWGYCSKCNKSF